MDLQSRWGMSDMVDSLMRSTSCTKHQFSTKHQFNSHAIRQGLELRAEKTARRGSTCGRAVVQKLAAVFAATAAAPEVNVVLCAPRRCAGRLVAPLPLPLVFPLPPWP